jgi:hypothetical protein
MVSDENLIRDLQELAERLGSIPTAREMRNEGPWSAKTYINHFESWNNALKESGLKTRNVSKEELIEDMKEFAEELGHVPTREEMEECGPWGGSTYESYFNSWNNSLECANLKTNKLSNKKLLENLQEVAEELGKTPTAREMKKFGPHCPKTYQKHFGSWNNALEEAGFEPILTHGEGEYVYGSGWVEARQETLERDNYTCQVCAYRDKSNHVHHIKPRRKFDDVSKSNTLDNLITLCNSCHSRFEGQWKDCSPDEFSKKAIDTLMWI